MEFAEKIRKTKIDGNGKEVRFNVVSLFTKIPIDEILKTLDIIFKRA